jgi:hypothetical protein
MITNDRSADEPIAASRGGLPRLATRSRNSAMGAVAAVVVVAALAGAIFATRGAGISVGRDPTPFPTATLSARQEQVLFTHAAPWGRLSLDGQQVSGTVATLPRGTSRLIYDAPPFPTLTCYISAPESPNDTCPEGTIPPTESFAGRVIDLGATLQRLAPAELDALIAATNAAMGASTSTAQVAAGDHYVDANGQIAVAAQAISATLSFVTPLQDVSYGGFRCAPFCTGPGPQPLQGEGLPFVVFPTPHWDFTAADGARWTVGEKPVNGNAIDMLVTWDGAWRVTMALAPMVGSTLEETALAAFPPSSAPAGEGGTGGGASASPIAAGVALPVYGGGDSHGLVLYHFGVAVAADAGARQLYPTMTVASAHEAALAAQLMGRG